MWFKKKKKKSEMASDIEDILKLAKKQGAEVKILHNISPISALNDLIKNDSGMLISVWSSTAFAVIEIILWAIKQNGLEKTLQDMRESCMGGEVHWMKHPINQDIYRGLLRMVRDVSKLAKEQAERKEGRDEV
jgi:hypothetical protein